MMALYSTLARLAFVLAHPMPPEACRLCIELSAIRARRSYCGVHHVAKLLRLL